eukprot:8867032-Alexandrium_andersonii.AAC.1
MGVDRRQTSKKRVYPCAPHPRSERWQATSITDNASTKRWPSPETLIPPQSDCMQPRPCPCIVSDPARGPCRGTGLT